MLSNRCALAILLLGADDQGYKNIQGYLGILGFKDYSLEHISLPELSDMNWVIILLFSQEVVGEDV